MYRVYVEYDGCTQVQWLNNKDLIIKEQETVDNFYEVIGNFKIAHIEILLMNHADANCNKAIDLPYLIVLKWSEKLRELYYFETILGAIEMLNKIIPVQEQYSTKKTKREQQDIDMQFITDEMIQEVMDNFDFEKVHDVMSFLNWTWQDEGVPNIDSITKSAHSLLLDIQKTSKESLCGDYIEISSGGFIAAFKKGFENPLSLSFYIEDY